MNARIILKHKLYNRLQSFLLMAVMAFILGYLAFIISGTGLAWLAVAGVIGFYLINPAVAPNLILRMTRARQLNYAQAPTLFETIAQLAKKAELTQMPQVYYIPHRLPNAFAVGQSKQSAIAVSDGLLRLLSPQELAGVLAHEISHIQNNDMRVMSFANISSQLTRMLSTFGQFLLIFNLPLILLGGSGVNWSLIFVLIIAPLISDLLMLGLSRVREFNADFGAAMLLGNPEPLASALMKMERYNQGLLGRFLSPNISLIPSIFRTHPPSAERIRRLRQLGPRVRREASRPVYRAMYS